MTAPGTVRAFVALEMPAAIREAIHRERRALEVELPRARWTRPEGQHLTLRFLGETPVGRIEELTASLDGALRGRRRVEIVLSGSGFFPNPRRPRVAWVGGEARGGAEAAAAVEGAAVACGFEPERRPWSLHLTQARLNRPWPRRAVERFLDWGRSLELPPFGCSEVVLFTSDLRPDGAVYTALERFPLT
ncbi:MAG: RNA 2',3'-cyclic phosphodiesterase [Thermoanaerobaculales bacterium]|jgi:2'-5' RNA ligase|nr:RNA 2',3'-cyclic phosphodiesterase [Thermoanaerobaculales bacterium]